MEVKNSGIPGPSAISWKRKSVEDSPTSGSVTKKRKVYDKRERDDPYSFDDDSDKSRDVSSQAGISSEQTNGSNPVTGAGIKFKSALSRDNDVESDESSMSGSSSPTKKKKRPKLEEWSVNKDKKNKSSKSPRKTERQSSKEESATANKNSKKSSLWGLPNNTKNPEENDTISEKVNSKESENSSEKSCAKSSVTNANVWLQAFGARGNNKVEKNDISENNKKILKKEKEPVVASSTILDIPPEVRRKSRPKFGGLIHFDPDWCRRVRLHHERCRVPAPIENSSFLKPKILAGHQTPKKSYEDQARKAMVSPPNMIALEKERLEKAAVTVAHKLPPAGNNDDELSGELPSIVETILENRKKLREASGSRIYKVPFMKEKKKRMMRAPVQTEIKAGPIGLLPTPGLPLFTNDTKDVLLGTGFGNFRHYTLSNFIQTQCRVTELPDTKPRRLANNSKPVINLKEIFGLETPSKKSKKDKEEKGKKTSEEKIKKEKSNEAKVMKEKSLDNKLIKREKSVEDKPKKDVKIKNEKSDHNTVLDVSSPAQLCTPVKKEKKRKSKMESSKSTASLSSSGKKATKFVPKFRTSTSDIVEPETENDCGYSHEVGDPSEEEKNLQFDLGAFALDLLEDNPSWSRQVAIQNLVIWEPTEPDIPEQAKKKKGKKKKARKSGMDFQSNKRKSKNCGTSRAGSPVEEDIHEVVYSLDNVIGESNRWVIDKNAGETILHRASKMGYPDVAAYALDMADMAAGERDYAGLTPLHKAALKGNSNVARILLSYGADPGAGIKGTRALHEGNNFFSQPFLIFSFKLLREVSPVRPRCCFLTALIPCYMTTPATCPWTWPLTGTCSSTSPTFWRTYTARSHQGPSLTQCSPLQSCLVGTCRIVPSSTHLLQDF